MALWHDSIKSFLFQLNNQPEFNKNEFLRVVLQNDDLWDCTGLCKFCWWLFICLCVTSTRHKMAFTLFSHLLNLSLLAVRIPESLLQLFPIGEDCQDRLDRPPPPWPLNHVTISPVIVQEDISPSWVLCVSVSCLGTPKPEPGQVIKCLGWRIASLQLKAVKPSWDPKPSIDTSQLSQCKPAGIPLGRGSWENRDPRDLPPVKLCYDNRKQISRPLANKWLP